MAREYAPGFSIIGGSPLDQELNQLEKSKQKPHSRAGGILSSFLPTIGGTLGAIGGGALGGLTTFGLGTGVGAAAGGAGGSALGEKLREMLAGENTNYASLGREAAFGALPGVGKILKGGKAALTAGRAAKAAEEAGAVAEAGGGGRAAGLLSKLGMGGVKDAEEAGAERLLARPDIETRPSGPLARESERLFGKQTGVKSTGQIIPGKAIGEKRFTDLKNLMRDEIGVKPTDAADTIYKRNADYIERKAGEVGDVLSRKVAPFTETHEDAFRKSIEANRPIGMTTEEFKSFQQAADDIAESAKRGGWRQGEFSRRKLDADINYMRGNAVDPKREQAFRAIRQSWDKLIKKNIPELVPLKKDLSKAYDIEALTLKAANKPGGVGPFGLKLGGRAIQGASGVGSKGLDVLSGLPGASAIDNAGVGKELLRQGGTRLGASAFLGTPFAGPTQEQPMEQQPMGASDILGGGEDTGIDVEQSQSDLALMPQALQIAAMQAIQQGDSATAKDLIGIAGTLGKQQETSAQDKQSTNKTKSANSIIDNLEQVFTGSGGARGPLAGRSTLALSALGGGNQQAKSYQEMRGAYTAQISRALGEVGVLTDKDREVIQQAIPSINDSEESAQIKIDTLRSILSDVANRKSQAGAGSSDSTAALLQLLGAGA